MKITQEMLKALDTLESELQSALQDYGISWEIEIGDSNGFIEAEVTIGFYNGVEVFASYNLETERIVTGEDADDELSAESLWRWLALSLVTRTRVQP